MQAYIRADADHFCARSSASAILADRTMHSYLCLKVLFPVMHAHTLKSIVTTLVDPAIRKSLAERYWRRVNSHDWNFSLLRLAVLNHVVPARPCCMQM